MNWDIQALREQYGGDDELIRDIILIFIDESLKTFEALKAAVQRADLEEARRFAHSLKGSSSMVALEELRQLAALVEQAAKEGRMDQLQERLPLLEGAYTEAIELLRAALRDLFRTE